MTRNKNICNHQQSFELVYKKMYKLCAEVYIKTYTYLVEDKQSMKFIKHFLFRIYIALTEKKFQDNFGIRYYKNIKHILDE
jgi:hypothetical protein